MKRTLFVAVVIEFRFITVWLACATLFQVYAKHAATTNKSGNVNKLQQFKQIVNKRAQLNNKPPIDSALPTAHQRRLLGERKCADVCVCMYIWYYIHMCDMQNFTVQSRIIHKLICYKFQLNYLIANKK